jgi:hypothetical protein
VHVNNTYNVVEIKSGGNKTRDTIVSTDYVISTADVVTMVGQGSKFGDVFSPVVHPNGTLIIESFNKLHDKINLTIHSEYHIFSDLIITRGSVIIHLPQNQEIKIINLYPEDVSDTNFIFSKRHNENTYWNNNRQIASYIGYVAVCLLMVYIAYKVYERHKLVIEETRLYKASLISDDQNPTRVSVEGSFTQFDSDSDISSEWSDFSEETNENESILAESECENDVEGETNKSDGETKSEEENHTNNITHNRYSFEHQEYSNEMNIHDHNNTYNDNHHYTNNISNNNSINNSKSNNSDTHHHNYTFNNNYYKNNNPTNYSSDVSVNLSEFDFSFDEEEEQQHSENILNEEIDNISCDGNIRYPYQLNESNSFKKQTQQFYEQQYSDNLYCNDTVCNDEQTNNFIVQKDTTNQTFESSIYNCNQQNEQYNNSNYSTNDEHV